MGNGILEPMHARERFYELVWPHRADIVRLARILSGNEAEADDLAQETLLKAFAALDRFRAGSDMMAWLATILRNTRIDRLRSSAASARNVSLEQLPIDPVDTAAPVPQWDDPHEVLNALGDQTIIDALQRLPEEIRWTLLLVDVGGMELKDAAGVLEIPVGTVKSRLHRGRAMLKDALAPLARQMRLIP